MPRAGPAPPAPAHGQVSASAGASASSREGELPPPTSHLEGRSLIGESLLRPYYVSGIDLSARTREKRSPAGREFIPVWETVR